MTIDNIKDDLKCSSVPQEIFSNLLFFNTWKNPDGFFNFSLKQRRILRDQMRKFAVDPARNNYWIWFGAYANRDRQPRYHNVHVARTLYNHLISPLGDKYLKARLVDTKADVNPYKYLTVHSVTRSERYAVAAANMGMGALEVIEKADPTGLMKEVDKCLVELNEYYAPGMFDERGDLHKMMLERGYAQLIVDAAFEKFDKPLK